MPIARQLFHEMLSNISDRNRHFQIWTLSIGLSHYSTTITNTTPHTHTLLYRHSRASLRVPDSNRLHSSPSAHHLPTHTLSLCCIAYSIAHPSLIIILFRYSSMTGAARIGLHMNFSSPCLLHFSSLSLLTHFTPLLHLVPAAASLASLNSPDSRNVLGKVLKLVPNSETSQRFCRELE